MTIDFKKQLHLTCINLVEEKLNTIKQLIDFANQASADDTKSSAGDKFETTREMMQQELDRLFGQLNETNKLLIQLKNINPESAQKAVKSGTLVQTNKGNFYIAVSLGGVKVNEIDVMSISLQSPIAQKMSNLKKGDEFVFNKITYFIENVI